MISWNQELFPLKSKPLTILVINTNCLYSNNLFYSAVTTFELIHENDDDNEMQKLCATVDDDNGKDYSYIIINAINMWIGPRTNNSVSKRWSDRSSLSTFTFSQFGIHKNKKTKTWSQTGTLRKTRHRRINASTVLVVQESRHWRKQEFSWNSWWIDHEPSTVQIIITTAEIATRIIIIKVY